jgi:hypothetical protein
VSADRASTGLCISSPSRPLPTSHHRAAISSPRDRFLGSPHHLDCPPRQLSGVWLPPTLADVTARRIRARKRPRRPQVGLSRTSLLRRTGPVSSGLWCTRDHHRVRATAWPGPSSSDDAGAVGPLPARRDHQAGSRLGVDPAVPMTGTR